MLFYISFGCAARRLDIHVTYTAILQTARSPPGPTHGHHSVMDSVPRAALTPLWLFRNCRHCSLFMLNQAIFPPIAYVAILFWSKLGGKVRGTGLVRHERWGGRRRTGQGCLSQAAGVPACEVHTGAGCRRPSPSVASPPALTQRGRAKGRSL